MLYLAVLRLKKPNTFFRNMVRLSGELLYKHLTNQIIKPKIVVRNLLIQQFGMKDALIYLQSSRLVHVRNDTTKI